MEVSAIDGATTMQSNLMMRAHVIMLFDDRIGIWCV
jgi:hypothetical protein